MLKIKTESLHRAITGVALTLAVGLLAWAGNAIGNPSGEQLAAKIGFDIGSLIPGLDLGIQTKDFSLNAGGGGDQPGCGGGNCLTVPDASAYSGIAVTGSLREALTSWTNFFLGFLSLIAMIAVVYAGFLYVTSAGNQEQADKAKKIIIYVVVGIIVIMLAYALVNTLISEAPKGSSS